MESFLLTLMKKETPYVIITLQKHICNPKRKKVNFYWSSKYQLYKDLPAVITQGDFLLYNLTMKIGLVGQRLFVENPAGVEKYIYYTFKNLAKVDKENEYIVYLTKEPNRSEWKDLIQGNDNFKYKVIEHSRLPLISWTQMLLAWELFKNPVDTIFYPYDTVSGLLNWFSPRKFKPICMIHDLGYIRVEEYKNPIIRFIHYFTIYYTIIFCKYLVVPTNAVKNNILKTYPKFKNLLYKESKIKVIPEGLNDNFYNLKENKSYISELREKYNIGNSDYFFFVSTIQPRKNIYKMIETFSKVIKENEKYKDIKLVISGKLGWSYEKDLTAPKKFNIEENVLFIGRTSDEELPILMKHSKGLINISVEEGFGLPILEAMALEIPLILSNIRVFKELTKEYALYANPLNTKDIAENIVTVLEGKYSKENIKEAYKISKQYTWEKSSTKIKELLALT